MVNTERDGDVAAGAEALGTVLRSGRRPDEAGGIDPYGADDAPREAAITNPFAAEVPVFEQTHLDGARREIAARRNPQAVAQASQLRELHDLVAGEMAGLAGDQGTTADDPPSAAE